jgi:tetratricopeptide (TPR) repeat protein
VCARNGHELDDTELDAIYAHTRGLPIIFNGLLRLHDGNVSELANVATQALKGDSSTSPPSEIRAMFAGQLERLDDDVRNLLTFASVQGNGFSAEILMNAAGISPEDFEAMVNDTLVGQHHLAEKGGISTIGQHRIQEYHFSHALLRDHIYLDRMTDFERSHLHLVTAEAALDLFGETDRDASSIIAFHLDRAGEINRAASAYVVAGDQAFDLSQFDRAWQAYNRVIELDVHRTNPLAEAQALLGLGNCARSLDHPGDAVIWINKAIDISRRRGFTAIHARALSALAMLDYDSGHVHKATERLRQAIDLHLEADDLDGASRSMARISYNLHGMGYYDEAALHARHGIELATQVGNDGHLVGARIALANCLLDLGMFHQAIALHEESAEIAANLADSHRINICLINISLCYIELGEWQAARDALDRMMAPGRTVVPRYVGVAWFQSGLIAEGAGRFDYALTCYEQSSTIRTGNGQEALLIDSRAGVLRIAIRNGDAATARELTREISARASQHGLDGIEHVALLAVTMAEAARLLGDHELGATWLAWGYDYLVTRANRLADPEHRHSYLVKILPHRRLLDMAAAAGFPPPI